MAPFEKVLQFFIIPWKLGILISSAGVRNTRASAHPHLRSFSASDCLANSERASPIRSNQSPFLNGNTVKLNFYFLSTN